jgi:hypothetical protein
VSRPLPELEPRTVEWQVADAGANRTHDSRARCSGHQRRGVSWLGGGHFLVQTYDTIFGDEPAQTGINYYFFEAGAKKFRIIFFSNNGPFTEDGNRYEGEIEGRTLTFVGPARFDATGKIRTNDVAL